MLNSEKKDEDLFVSGNAAKPIVVCSAVDNMELLLSQPDETIDLIYSDVLYGTGRDFMDYKDLYPMKEIIYEHYKPRIKEMYRVLKHTGSIYLQMDYRIVHWVRCIMDDVFGYGNFKNEIIWHYRTGGTSKKYFSRKHDNILFYTKTNDYTFNNPKKKSYINKSKGYNPYTEQHKDDNGIFCYTNEVDVWDIQHINMHDKKNRNGYASQKPKALIERIIKSSSNEGDTVADYYLGSGTTAVVCQELNRNFIGCDINEKAIELTKKRLLNEVSRIDSEKIPDWWWQYKKANPDDKDVYDKKKHCCSRFWKDFCNCMR